MLIDIAKKPVCNSHCPTRRRSTAILRIRSAIRSCRIWTRNEMEIWREIVAVRIPDVDDIAGMLVGAMLGER
ncbi:hypothetical protein [Burkholderia humptydooensis]|uniref:hypothetical protein n=1 Tax=Burkholderia humptydooensis TaxID=430531 RepID=UPI0003A428FB|nr:hypothetical protein [Burkholderia humptydooensis]